MDLAWHGHEPGRPSPSATTGGPAYNRRFRLGQTSTPVCSVTATIADGSRLLALPLSPGAGLTKSSSPRSTAVRDLCARPGIAHVAPGTAEVPMRGYAENRGSDALAHRAVALRDPDTPDYLAALLGQRCRPRRDER